MRLQQVHAFLCVHHVIQITLLHCFLSLSMAAQPGVETPVVMPALLGVVFARGFRVSLLQPGVGLVMKSILHIRNQHLNEMK